MGRRGAWYSVGLLALGVALSCTNRIVRRHGPVVVEVGLTLDRGFGGLAFRLQVHQDGTLVERDARRDIVGTRQLHSSNSESLVAQARSTTVRDWLRAMEASDLPDGGHMPGIWVKTAGHQVVWGCGAIDVPAPIRKLVDGVVAESGHQVPDDCMHARRDPPWPVLRPDMLDKGKEPARKACSREGTCPKSEPPVPFGPDAAGP